MRVLLRADADARRGGGHVARCLTLGSTLRQLGHAVGFCVNSEARATVPALADFSGDDGAAVDAVVVDHYDYSVEEELRLRAERSARVLVVIDDLADRSHACDLLVDSGLGRTPSDYAGLVTRGAPILAGASYAIVRRDVVALRETTLARRTESENLRRIVVAFGLSDAGPQVAAAIKACRRAVPDIAVDVITGPAGRASAEAIVHTHPGAKLHVNPASYAMLLADADLAIGAPGGAAFERCVLGVPTVLVPIAENQRSNANALVRAGAALSVDDGSGLASRIAEAVRTLHNDRSARAAMSSSAASCCDGDGVTRVAAAIAGLDPVPGFVPGEPLLRPAHTADTRLLWVWRNDPVVRSQSRYRDLIQFAAHREWLAERLSSADTWMTIAEVSGEPVGVLRFDRGHDGEVEISITIAPQARGQGLGRTILRKGCEAIYASGFATRLKATVHRENLASRALFASAGFSILREDGGWLDLSLEVMPSGLSTNSQT